MDLQRFKLLPCDGIESSHSPYRLIPTLPIVVQLVGGVCQPIRCRRELPILLQYLSYLVFLRLDIRVCQQSENVVAAKRESVDTCTCHDVKYKFTHLYLQSVAVATDNLLQGFGMQQRRCKPHTALFFGGELPVLQIVEESRYLRFQLLQEVGIVRLQAVYLPHPIASFPCVYDDGQILVVGTQHELGKERNLITVFAFGFHLVGQRGTEVL